ncbi:MAG: DUF4238 domain-containing protein [Saprospiraceae bacterium]
MKANRHHYLPQFYIHGFVNSDNKISVYDKQEKRFKKQEFSPKQIFFEWNRNTLLVEGKKDDSVEKLYGYFESLISPTYNRIKMQSGRIKYDINDIFNLLVLVSLTHWRLPLNDVNAENFVQSTPRKDLIIKIFNKETGEEASEDLYEKVKKRNGFVEMYKLLKPIIDFMSLNMKNSIEHWKIYRADSEIQSHILGDNPIVFKDQPQNNILETELIFPLTKGIMLYHNKGKKIKQIQPEDRVNVDIMIFLQSRRYVVGSNKDYLNKIKSLAQGCNTKSEIEILRNEIFEIFE